MSTRSLIGTVNNGKIEYIYCHFDGYLEYVGDMLKHYYTDKSVIDKLLDLGDLSSLGTTPFTDPTYWTSNEPYAPRNTSLCVSYKDRGESNVDKKVINDNIEEYLQTAESFGVDFIYLFKDNIWYYLCMGDEDLSQYKTF